MGRDFATGAPSEDLECGARGTGVSPPPPNFVAPPPSALPPMTGGGIFLDLQADATLLLSYTRIICLREGWSGRTG